MNADLPSPPAFEQYQDQLQLQPPATPPPSTPRRLIVKFNGSRVPINNMPVATRNGGRHVPAPVDDDEQDAYVPDENDSGDMDADGDEDEEAPAPPPLDDGPPRRYPTRGNSVRRSSGSSNPPAAAVQKEESSEDEHPVIPTARVLRTTAHGRLIRQPVTYDEGSDDDLPDRRSSRHPSMRTNGKRKRSVLPDPEFIEEAGDDVDPEADYGRRLRSRRSTAEPSSKRSRPPTQQPARVPHRRTTRNSSGLRRSESEFSPGSGQSPQSSNISGQPGDLVDVGDEEDDMDVPEEDRVYNLRERSKKVNYAVLPPLGPEEAERDVARAAKAKSVKSKKPPLNMTGRALNKFLGLPPVDSDDDDPVNTPRKPAGFPAPLSAAGGSMFAPSGLGDLGGGVAGTPSNLGRVNADGALADADPLGVSTNITFDAVGGLDDHIKQLKEMVSLPLLYPEVFQQFNVTPPRGVLFYGPPGTGKTLMARALAASCSTGTTKISFFMRKGADCLSKWVGEAERQLRLLFEEARASQPSIIFFDEIDGLAPVRSSKQDQIHASIVSTLLALMDGMDGRGQVIVIGATNRPDAVDPALRRPGRFDREFYFPLPTLEARKKIIEIHTKDWQPPLEDSFKDQLAELTKGYGGADLRALCTEASLNAVQRRYPQIYKTNDRLVIDPATIHVQARDFMHSIKVLIPSSARSASSAAAPLPPQLAPLLLEAVEKATETLDKALPQPKKRNILEEAEWEEEDGGFEKEILLQSMDTLRVYRPRVLIHGPVGMGQNFIAAAALHHLEGFNVQSLDLGTLMSDSTRTPEAAVVQLFVEAKRHKPSVVYIPSLLGWANAVTQTLRSTVKAMLDSLSPSDPVLLLAIVDGPLSALPKDVRAWFGYAVDNRVHLTKPSMAQREAFFAELLKMVDRPPTEFPDAMPKKKRVLEELPLAPPLPPRQPTAAELQMQRENDARYLANLKGKLNEVVHELKKKYRRFYRSVREDFNLPLDYVYAEDAPAEVEAELEPEPEPNRQGTPTPQETNIEPNGVDSGAVLLTNGDVEHHVPEPEIAPQPRLHKIDLVEIHSKIWYEGYLSPREFVADLGLITHNTGLDLADAERHFKAMEMKHRAEELISFYFEPAFLSEIEKVAVRERQRRAEEAKTQAENEKGKGKGKAVSGSAYAPGTRQSARVNGRAPEFGLADLGMLEKQKRKRSSSSEKENPSGSGEGEGDAEGEQRGRKRVRIIAPEQVDDAPGSIEAAAVATPPPTDGGAMATAIQDVFMVYGVPADAITTTAVEDAVPRLESVDTGPEDTTALIATHGSLYTTVTTGLPPMDPFAPLPAQHTSPIPPSPLALTSIPEHLIPEPLPIIPSREPTPVPSPVFQLSEHLLSQLREELVTKTDGLNVEQLEQLRALELDKVWRARADWNRDGLVQGMIAMVHTFVGEVSGDDMDVDL